MNNRWAPFFLVAAFPILPLWVYFSDQVLQELISVRIHPNALWLSYFVVWLTLFGMSAFLVCRSAPFPKRDSSNFIFWGFLTLIFIPPILVGIWVISSPHIPIRIFLLFSLTSFFPLAFFLVWEFFLKNLVVGESWVNVIVLPVSSGLLTLILFEVFFGSGLRKQNLVQNISAMNSPDRSYWYYARYRENGIERANSYGFVGPEPNSQIPDERVLLIGDSIPAAERHPRNFPTISQEKFNKEFHHDEKLEMINASIAAYSVEQIYLFYSEKLRDLPHNYLIFSFYLDDVNRNLRYRKNNRLYSPDWAEWQQDVYWQCYLCQRLLSLCNVSDHLFLNYRKRSYEEAFPDALRILEKTRLLANSRGAKFAVLNIPRFTWEGVLPNVETYQYFEMNKALERWCIANGVPCYDTLPLLIGKEISTIRRSKTDIHFTYMGHQIVGLGLKDFLASLIRSGTNTRGPGEFVSAM
ncbi:SGNH/GDSL hydrolase family protein [Nitrospira sp. MA-1]|nr:SGNH/GDSL hydrolase family protein [Nitrospira sp. MA-1]